jgi:glycogen operon protein
MTGAVRPGKSFPLGATVYPDGVNFTLFSKNAQWVDLLLFECPEDPHPSRIVSLDPRRHRTYHYWHVFVEGVTAGQVYAYRVAGPFDPSRGHRFDHDKVLLDPYGRGVIVPDSYDRDAGNRPGDNCAVAMKSIVADRRGYDWEGDTPLGRPFGRSVAYEMHLAGFTKNPNSGVSPEKRGTYAGLIEKIPYLVELGVTAIEILPVFQFDPWDCPKGLVNYWGYAPVSFFAPHRGYSSRKDPLGPLDEFRDMVKALHRAGIEVIMDVVYNHTAEGDVKGPTNCFKGLENSLYYILDSDKSRYSNYSGTGNTLNANQPVVRRLIIDSLHYWVEEMHVDGFRFDLASILSRDEKGRPLENPPILWDIESDPVLAGIKLIAEAWDAAGLYQVGSFIGDSWKEWNGQFRDDVRAFVRGDAGMVSRLAARLLGSPDLFGHEEREPEQSVNFVTCHDGFTLNDLVSYDHKHNDANLENSKDGTNDNLSWNCGVEGPTDDPEIEALRERQVKNFYAITLLALGTPMILMGDEVRHTQFGNNNAYCQDNELSWFDWSLVEKNGELFRFVSHLIQLRLRRDESFHEHGMTLNQLLKFARVHWHGVKLGVPDWSHESHSLAFTAFSLKGGFVFHTMLNGFWEPLEFELPPLSQEVSYCWRRWFDTSRPSPGDICDWESAPTVISPTYHLPARSVAVLFARTRA